MRTPSQTVGPYFSFGLCTEPANELPGGAVEVAGRVLDGEGAPITDALLELWNPDIGFGRCPTDGDGRYSFRVPPAAARFELMVFARGLLRPAVTRLYLRDDGAEHPTLVAQAIDGGYRFDIRLQGADATCFFDL